MTITATDMKALSCYEQDGRLTVHILREHLPEGTKVGFPRYVPDWVQHHDDTLDDSPVRVVIDTTDGTYHCTRGIARPRENWAPWHPDFAGRLPEGVDVYDLAETYVRRLAGDVGLRERRHPGPELTEDLYATSAEEDLGARQ